jgi:hypothetical protein
MVKRKFKKSGLARSIERYLLLLAACAMPLLGHSALASQASSSSSGTAPFIFDDNRIFVELQFVRPDGTLRRALAFVDIGTPEPVLLETLFKEQQVDRKRPLVFRVGEVEIQVEAALVQHDTGSFMTGPNGKATIPVEAVLPGSVMKSYQVVFDYASQTLTIARPNILKPKGISPCRVE